jgi:hypothetical protein
MTQRIYAVQVQEEGTEDEVDYVDRWWIPVYAGNRFWAKQKVLKLPWVQKVISVKRWPKNWRFNGPPM